MRRWSSTLALLSLLLLQGAVSFRGASIADSVGNYDTAWYYAVARNVAQGEWRSDDVLWHWLGAPETVARPAGDYWGPGWPFLLGGLMSLTGHTMKHALWICACLSLGVPLLVFMLARALGSGVWLSWLAGLIAIFQERLVPLHFTPDVALPFELSVLGGLCLLLWAARSDRARLVWVAAGFVLGLSIWLRGDGFVVFMGAFVATILEKRIPARVRRLRAVLLLCGMIPCAVSLVAYNEWAFGATTPPPRGMTPWMTGFEDLYLYTVDPSAENVLAKGLGHHLGWIGYSLNLRVAQLLLELPLPLLLLSAVGCAVGMRGEKGTARGVALIVALLVSFWMVPALLAPVVTSNPGRFTQLATPLASVLSVLGIGWVTSRLSFSAALSGRFALAVCCLVWFWPLQMRNPVSDARWKPLHTGLPDYLRPGNVPDLRPDDVIMSTDPWQTAAVLDRPTVMIPIDHNVAIEQVSARYHARLFLFVNGSHWQMIATMSGGTSRGLGKGLPLVLLSQTGNGAWYEFKNPGVDAGQP